MQLLTPFALILSMLAIPIILLYMLKLRRMQTQVSSTLLWEKILRDKQANTPWQKLKRNLLLFLQLLILAALVFALARPAMQTRVVASGQVIVLLDASASMNATDVTPNRFEEAKRAIDSIIDGMTSSSSMTLILVAQSPQTLISAETDHALLKSALNGAKVSQGSADWDAAFALAAGAAHGGANPIFVIVSDGGLPESGLPSLPGDARYVPVGKSNDNLAISALALRESNGKPQLFAQVKNYGDKNRAAIFSLYVNEELFLARQMEIPAGAEAGISLEGLPDNAGIYKAHISNFENLDAPLDALPLDDIAFAVYQPSAARRVLLVSKGNLFLEQLLTSLPGIQPFRALPKEDGTLQIPNEPFDLYVFDGYVPEKLPSGNILFVNPKTNTLFEVGENFDEIKNVQVNEHTLTRYVDWKNVHVLQARKINLPVWMNVLIESDSNPLVFAGEKSGQRIAGVSFDLRESDLPLQVAYPILFSNLINYLAPPSAFDSTQSLNAGESLLIAAQTDAKQTLVSTPSGQIHSLPPGQNIFSQTQELGYYAVNFVTENSTRAEYFAVNLFDPLESDLQPREALKIGSASVTPAVSQQIGLQELWTWLALFALIILMVEWQAFHRKRIHLFDAARRN